MPIRGLREEAYKSGKAVYENNILGSQWAKYIPEGHVDLKNVMFAPLKTKEKTVGLIGFSNKDGDFTEEDASIATAFGEMISIALLNNRSLDALKESEEKFRLAFDNANTGMRLVDLNGNFIKDK